MAQPTDSRRYYLWALYTFAAVAVASISLQNFIWVAVALFLFFQIKGHQKFDWPQGLFVWATLLFTLSFFTAALWGINPGNSFLTVHKYLTLLLVFLVGAIPLVWEDIQKLLAVFVYGAAFCAAAGIFKHFYYHQDRIDSFSGDKMVFGGMLMVALLVVFWFLKREPRKIWFWICAILLAVALVFTQTRGAWLGWLAGFIFLSWKLNRKWLLGFSLVFALSLAIFPHPLLDRFKNITNLNISYTWNNPHEIQNSSNVRLLIWVCGIKMIKDYPWGIGQGNISEIYPHYRLGSLDTAEPDIPHLHNNFLQLLLQNGWIGFAAYLFWIFSYYWKGFKFQAGDKDVEYLNWVFLSIFSAVLVWGLTEYTFGHQFMNVQFFLLGLQVRLWKGPNNLNP